MIGHYTNLQEVKTDSKVVVFGDNYYFAFDEAWLNNYNNTIYVKMNYNSIETINYNIL